MILVRYFFQIVPLKCLYETAVQRLDMRLTLIAPRLNGIHGTDRSDWLSQIGDPHCSIPHKHGENIAKDAAELKLHLRVHRQTWS